LWAILGLSLFALLPLFFLLRDDGLTQAEIGEKIGWSTTKVKDYSRLLTTVVAEVLSMAKTHEQGRATKKVATATFTEGWFRNSGAR